MAEQNIKDQSQPSPQLQSAPPNWKTHACALMSTAFGLGFIPGAPGTAGTLLGVGIYALIASLLPAGQHMIFVGIALLITCAASVPLGAWAEKHWQRKDPGRFVLDEVAGYLLTVLLFRSGSVLLTMVWAFVFFRLFDILKPPPAKRD